MTEFQPVVIPYQQIAPETLQALLESYINREGTDYGVHESSLEEKLAQLRQQLKAGEVCICYDEASESVNLLTRQQLKQSQA